MLPACLSPALAATQNYSRRYAFLGKNLCLKPFVRDRESQRLFRMTTTTEKEKGKDDSAVSQQQNIPMGLRLEKAGEDKDQR